MDHVMVDTQIPNGDHPKKTLPSQFGSFRQLETILKNKLFGGVILSADHRPKNDLSVRVVM